jgi:hypothetical protein
MRRILVRLEGAAAEASPGYVTAGATPKAGENTGKVVMDLTEVSLFLGALNIREC